MSNISSRNGRTITGRGALVGVLVALTAIVSGVIASPASAAGPAWRITSVHGPQNMAPSSTGQYVVSAYNIGDTDTDGTTVTIRDMLPPNVVATSAVGRGWTCTGIGTQTVECATAAVVATAGISNLARGVAAPVVITVAVGPGAAGTADNAVTISGGGAPDASATDPTPFDQPPAPFGFVPGSVGADLFDAAFPAGAVVRQAGSHPFEARVDFKLNLALKEDPDDPVNGDVFYTTPVGHVKTLATKLPPGLIGDPQATPRCSGLDLVAGGLDTGGCAANTQVGSADLLISNGKRIPDLNVVNDVPVYNLAPPPGAVAGFAFSYLGNPVIIDAALDPSDHYAVVATVRNAVEVLDVRGVNLTLWGVPADPAHDPLRVNSQDPNAGTTAYGTSSNADIKPFLTMPSLCGIDGAIQLRADSWEASGAFTDWQAGTPAQMTGCDDARFRFEPTMTVQPEAKTPSTPTGLDVDLTVPQKDDTVTDASVLYAGSGDDRAIATPPLRDVKVVLPVGMSVSPSSADGLAACTPLQIGLGTNADPACPDASKLGTVSIETPLLPNPLRGSLYFAAQNDNPFGSMLAVYIVASGPGVVIKLPGKIAPDLVTGQLTATFDDNPQVPFSKMHLHFNSGPRAPLVTPPTCGVKTSTVEMTAWNLDLPTVRTSDSFTIDSNCAKGFDPGFTAGTKDAIAGKDSPLVTRFTRSDNDQELSTIDVTLPKGLLGRISSIDLCPDAAAAGGTCGEGSRIGTATVGAGPGPNPMYITDGRVYMTGPYKGAPFGLSIVVHAKAGPLDLGNVIVRAAVFVDKQTAALRIVSDPMPTILQGIPLLMRMVDITVDRPAFTFNPTSCATMSSTATIGSTEGKASTKSSRFRVADCAVLPFAPKMTMKIGSKRHVGRGKSTPLTAVVQMPAGQANLRGVKVTLPKTVNARLNVINHACTMDEFHAGNCAKAKAGTAVAVTPLLRDPLKGDVFFVKNGGPLPDMIVALRGQVAVDLDSKVTIPGSERLSTNFDSVPDVPISKFTLRLVSGRQGPLGTAANLCTKKSRRARASLAFVAQSGKTVYRSQRLSVAGCKKAKAKAKAKKAHAKAKAKATNRSGVAPGGQRPGR